MEFMVVIRSGRWADEGAVVTIDGYTEMWRFARDWQARHPLDRLSIFSPALGPIFALDQNDAHAGNCASGTLS